MFTQRYLFHVFLIIAISVKYAELNCFCDKVNTVLYCNNEWQLPCECKQILGIPDDIILQTNEFRLLNCSENILQSISNNKYRKYLMINSLSTKKPFSIETILYHKLNEYPEWTEFIIQQAEILTLNYKADRPILKVLEVLILHDAKISSIDLKYFSNFQALKTLVLSNNELKKINFTLPPNLEYLSISGNKLTNIDGVFLNQKTQLKQLDFSENPIKQIDFRQLYQINTYLPKLFRLNSIPCEAIDSTQFKQVKRGQNLCKSNIWSKELCSQVIVDILINENITVENIILDEVPKALFYPSTKWWLIKINGINCFDPNEIKNEITPVDETAADLALTQMGGEAILFYIQSLIWYIRRIINQIPVKLHSLKEQEDYNQRDLMLKALMYKLITYRSIIYDQIDWDREVMN